MRLHNFISTKEKRRDLRKNMTDSERILWSKIKNDKLGHRFRRQFSVGHYIIDFYCPRKKLAIELDGVIHLHQKEYDAVRDKFMKDFEITVLRFWNDDIRHDLNGVLMQIEQALTRE
jgi:very-short-patch-repair endonuclease